MLVQKNNFLFFFLGVFQFIGIIFFGNHLLSFWLSWPWSLHLFLYPNKQIRGQRKFFPLRDIAWTTSTQKISGQCHMWIDTWPCQQKLEAPLGSISFSYWCDKCSMTDFHVYGLMRSLNLFPIVPECGYLDLQRCMLTTYIKQSLCLSEKLGLCLLSIPILSYSSGIWNK